MNFCLPKVIEFQASRRELRDQLRSKESKINKLKQVLDDLDDLRFFQPHRHQEVEVKTAIVNEMIEKSLTDARQLLVRIAHGCEKCNPEE